MPLTLFKIGFIPVTVMDIADILIMSFVLYRSYAFIRGTRAAQMLAGLIIILLFSILTPLLQMRGISWIFQNLRTVWLVAFVILFQPELRRILLSVGQSRVIRYFVKVSGSKVIDEVVDATEQLQQRGYGALIVMGRETGMKMVTETGVSIQAEVSAALLVSIFNPRSPLHDGAVIIINDVIDTARCILPLSENTDPQLNLGTRHRAAVGLSEDSDAVVIVVSEETGRISVAVEGTLKYDLSLDNLRLFLYQTFNQTLPKGERSVA
ncbi:MAG TPA: diadenylate cyclase CdaA [bacterium]|nr:diadenylate cyclase CdaA [bacterium]HQI49581.1 diadenylate cyclase CdaA [bacterium]HQJ65646.1 diadenylate cyclase CdaA [bacterium]